eukprot:1034409-Prorocentrum_minimum.AAC.1
MLPRRGPPRRLRRGGVAHLDLRRKRSGHARKGRDADTIGPIAGVATGTYGNVKAKRSHNGCEE